MKLFLIVFISLQKEIFISSESVCKAVQDYVFLSKYNLKRYAPKRKNVITFVCTCIAQKSKNIPNFKLNKLDEQSSLKENFFDNASTITIADSTSISQVSSSQVMATSFDEIDNVMEKVFLSQKRTIPKERQIKCNNNQSCTFRLKFIQNELTKTFQFSSTIFPQHNHPPAKSSTKVSNVKYIC